MAAAWQQWMPLYIQRLKSNPFVIAMHPSARAGYIWLVTEQWQTDDCTLPNDVRTLKAMSGLGPYWDEHAEEILERFSAEGDRLRNTLCYELWMEAKARYEESQMNYEFLKEQRSRSGKYGVQVREAKRLVTNQANTKHNLSTTQAEHKQDLSKTEAKSCLTDTYTETNTNTNTKAKKPSGDKRQPDERHTPFRSEIETSYQGGGFAWDASEAKALSNLLGANPKLTLEGFRRLMGHRARSEAVNLAQRPRAWLERITDYANGPLDRFNKPRGSDGQVGRITGKAEQRNNQSRDSIARAAQSLGIWQAPGADGADEGGEPSTGFAGGHGDDLDARLDEAGIEARPTHVRAGAGRTTNQAGPEILPGTTRDSGGVRGYGS